MTIVGRKLVDTIDGPHNSLCGQSRHVPYKFLRTSSEGVLKSIDTGKKAVREVTKGGLKAVMHEHCVTLTSCILVSMPMCVEVPEDTEGEFQEVEASCVYGQVLEILWYFSGRTLHVAASCFTPLDMQLCSPQVRAEYSPKTFSRGARWEAEHTTSCGRGGSPIKLKNAVNCRRGGSPIKLFSLFALLLFVRYCCSVSPVICQMGSGFGF
jgi:hypothetical protein